tara:strand:- start:101260 stop:101799 length:540 start_codon:yes stop_codon:yes gene_type:complete
MNINKFLKYPILLIALLLLSAGNEENTNPSSLKITGNGNNQYLLSIEDDQTSNSSKILTVNQNGIIHIGKSLKRSEKASDGYLLYVKDGIRTERVKVDIANKAGWADYVFEKDYNLLSIEELKEYIHKNKHLPGVPSSSEVVENGLELAESNRILLEKIEELNLHIIALNDRLSILEAN